MTHRHLLQLALFAWIFTFDLGRETDVDFWWHVRTGELIAQTGAVPATDPFSYTAAGRPWVAHEWLWELAIARIVALGGYGAAVIISSCIVTLTYFLLYLLLRRVGVSEIVAAILVFWAATQALPNLGVRPRELSLLLMVIYLHRLWPWGSRRSAGLWLLPPLMVLWANLHGGFILGIAVLGLVAVGETARWLHQRGEPPWQLWLAGVATVLAVAVNPLGPEMLLYPFTYLSQGNSNPSFGVVTEFMSPDFHYPLTFMFGVGLVLLLAVGTARGAMPGLNALLAAAFLLQALISTRQLAPGALVLALVFAVSLHDRFAWARAKPSAPQRPLITVINWVVLAFLIVGGLAFMSTPAVRSNLQLGWEPEPSDMPVAGARYIQEHQLPDPVFNQQEWGGYLIYSWHPHRKVFIDGRIDMYGDAIVRDYVELNMIQPGWRGVIEKYGIRTVLTAKNSPLSSLLLAAGGWQRVFQGEIEDVLVARDE